MVEGCCVLKKIKQLAIYFKNTNQINRTYSFPHIPPTEVKNQWIVGILLAVLYWFDLAMLKENWHSFLHARKCTFTSCCVLGSVFKVIEVQAKLSLTKKLLKGGSC